MNDTTGEKQEMRYALCELSIDVVIVSRQQTKSLLSWWRLPLPERFQTLGKGPVKGER